MTVEEYHGLCRKEKRKSRLSSARIDATGLLIEQIRQLGLPIPMAEYRFHPTRRWRFDLCWPEIHKVALEIEGGIWVKGRHTRGSGFLKDMEKYNTATLMGWKVFRVAPQQVENGMALSLILDIFSINSKNKP